MTSSSDEEITAIPAARLCELVRRRALSPVEIMEAHLGRAAKLNRALNAIVAFAPDALAQARAAERAVMSGARVPALHGLPVTIKDTIDTAALRTTSGSRTRARRVPEADAPAVRRLRAAGAIVYGKTNCSELAIDYDADNPVHGRTNNPHDLARTPGGSSGGCAAAVGACLSPASLGSDLVGSIRIPAHFCGVAGLFPTPGRVPTSGHFPPTEGTLAAAASLGPLARTVEDLALLFDALTHDEDHAAQVVSHTNERDRMTTSEGRLAVSEIRLRGLRVAAYTDDGRVRASEETERAVESAASALAAAGLEVVHTRPPEIEGASDLWLALFPQIVVEIVRAEFAGREELAGAAAGAILRRRERTTAPAVAFENNADAWAKRERLRRSLLERMRATPLLLAPVGAVAAYAHGARKVEVRGVEINAFRAFGFAQACNVYGLPAATVPAGRMREGLPVGVQLIGRPLEERLVLAAARVVEAASGGGWQRPSPALPSERDNPL
ncbi:MAG TPA: amidase [Pyrinomonadaceae bacterium]